MFIEIGHCLAQRAATKNFVHIAVPQLDELQALLRQVGI